MMNKIKILLGEQNAHTMLIGLIKYSILYLLLKFLQPWIVGVIWVVGATILSFFLIYEKEKKESDAKVDIGLLLATTAWVCFPLSVLQAVAYCFTFRYIDWVGIPAFTVANMILWMFVFDRCDDEPRTKTTPSDKEATDNEYYTVVSKAQDVPAGDHGPDFDGDPEIEEPKKYSGRYNWNTGEPVKREEDK